jgi:hypothetical protein
MPDIFISYAKKDRKKILPLARALGKNIGVKSSFLTG